MLKMIPNVKRIILSPRICKYYRTTIRNFLSQAYYCNEVWDHRLRNPILQKVKLEELYQNLDNRFNKTRTISAVDVDVFVNTVQDEMYVDELLDLVYKLRLSAATGNTLNSTSHAVVRYLLAHGRHNELLTALEDRLNYGVFLDHYTANMLMDVYCKNKDYVSGARVGSQLMYQEDFEHPLTCSFALLHCYNFLLNPVGWPEHPQPQEPEEEIKIRVKYLRNPYYDDHFDIKEPIKIVGKTIWMITKNLESTLDKSLHLIGLALHEKTERATKLIETLSKSNEKIYSDVLTLLPEDNEVRKEISKLQTDSANVQSLLEDRVKQAERQFAERDIAFQCEQFSKWEAERKDALEKQLKLLEVEKRLQGIEKLQQSLKERETKLWFFDKEEEIELQIEAKEIQESTKQIRKTKTSAKVEEEYIPPEIK